MYLSRRLFQLKTLPCTINSKFKIDLESVLCKVRPVDNLSDQTKCIIKPIFEEKTYRNLIKKTATVQVDDKIEYFEKLKEIHIEIPVKCYILHTSV